MKFTAELFSGSGYKMRHVGTVTADTLTTIKRLASRICNNYFSVYDRMELIEFVNIADMDGVRVVENHYVFARHNKKTPDNTIRRGEWR
jgi:hypothetical protein